MTDPSAIDDTGRVDGPRPRAHPARQAMLVDSSPDETFGQVSDTESVHPPITGDDAHALMSLIMSSIRIEILLCLAEGPADVTALALATGREMSHLSHQLAGMLSAGLVTATRSKKRRNYQLGPSISIRRVGPSVIVAVSAPEGHLLATFSPRGHGVAVQVEPRIG